MSKLSHRLQVLVSKGLQARIVKAAQRASMPQGECVRQAIEKALREPAAVRDPLQSLAALGGPTADIQQMLAEIEAGRT